MPPTSIANPTVRRVAMIAAVLAAMVAVSHQSFWIDEANAAWKAVQPSPKAWWHSLKTEGGSDAQMPLYMAALWAWEKIAGRGEWALRSLNLVWVLPGIYCFAGRKVERWLVAAVSAFAWYCLDEARPYGMQIGASLLLFGMGERMLTPSSTDGRIRPTELWLFVLGLVALAGSSLLGVIWAGAAIGTVAVARSWSGRELRPLPLMLPAVVLVVTFTALVAYYAWTLKQGARASGVGGTDARNIVFIAYELLGFAGLGPGRTDLRASGLAAFRPYLLPLGLLATACGAVILTGMVHIWRTTSRRTLLTCAVILGGAAFLLVAAAYLKHFRLLGRHCAPLLPVVLALQAAGLAALGRRKVGGTLVVGFLILGLGSSASLRFASRHSKDDYRQAAATAIAALEDGKVVWWNADPIGAQFYGLPISTDTSQPQEALLQVNPPPGFAAQLADPDVVIASKPDIYDAQSSLAAYLKTNGYRPATHFMAFTVWNRAGEIKANK